MSTSTAARQALLAKTTTRAFAGTIPSDQYEPGDDLNITREAHLALLLHHIKSMISDDAENAPVHHYITNAISYYKLANETSFAHAKKIKEILGSIQAITDMATSDIQSVINRV